jgi:hypothetical protein
MRLAICKYKKKRLGELIYTLREEVWLYVVEMKVIKRMTTSGGVGQDSRVKKSKRKRTGS